MKATTASEQVKPDFKRNHLLQFLLVFYLALWAALAISPLDRSDWLLENLLVFSFRRRSRGDLPPISAVRFVLHLNRALSRAARCRSALHLCESTAWVLA